MKINLYVLFFILITSYSFGQKIVKDEVDEFTRDTIKISSWTKMAWTGNMNSYARFHEVNNINYLNFRFIVEDEAYSVKEGDLLYLKLDNNEIIKL